MIVLTTFWVDYSLSWLLSELTTLWIILFYLYLLHGCEGVLHILQFCEYMRIPELINRWIHLSFLFFNAPKLKEMSWNVAYKFDFISIWNLKCSNFFPHRIKLLFNFLVFRLKNKVRFQGNYASSFGYPYF